MQLVSGDLTSLLERPRRPSGPQDDVRVESSLEGVDNVGVVARDEQHRMPGRQRREVGHQRLELVGARDQQQAATLAEAPGCGVDLHRELAVGEGPWGAHEGGPVAEAGQVACERDHGGAVRQNGRSLHIRIIVREALPH